MKQIRTTATTCLLLLSACSAQQRAPDPGSTAPLDVSPAVAKGDSLNATDIFAMKEGSATFTLLNDGGKNDGSITIKLETTKDHHAHIASSEGEDRTEFTAIDDQKRITLTAVIDRKEKVLTLFEPPLIIAPPSLKLGETFTAETSMRVVALDNPSKQREHGPVKRTITYASSVIVRTPGGDVPAAQIQIHFTADLQAADVDEHETMYVSREKGLVASDSSEKVVILGAFPKTTRQIMLREGS